MSVQAGAVWLPVLPDMSKWNATLRTGMNLTGMSRRGQEAGQSFSSAMMRSVRTGMSPLSAEVGAQTRTAAAAAARAVEQADAKMVAASRKLADANGKERVAAQRLADLREKGKATATQMVSAEERLAAVQRQSAAAAEAAGAASSELAAAQQRAAATTTELGAASTAASGRFGVMAGQVGRGADRMGSKIGKFAKGAAALGGVFAGFELVKFAGESVKSAQEFQQGSNVLVTAAGESVNNLGMVRSGLLKISSTTGTSLDQMTEGMYTVEKAGYRGAKGLAIMDAAAKGAKDEGADLGVVTNGLTTMMNLYGKQLGNPSRAMNALMVAAGHSKTTLQEFTNSLGNVLPVGSKAGLSFNEIAGALGTMTSQGMSARRASMNLNKVIISLSNPTKVMSEEMQSFGLNSADVMTNLGKRGLTGTLELLSSTIKAKMGPAVTRAANTLRDMPTKEQGWWASLQHGTMTLTQFNNKVTSAKDLTEGQKTAIKGAVPASQSYLQAMTRMTGGNTGLAVSMMLTGNAAKGFKSRTEEVGHAMNSTKDFTDKWGMSSKTTANSLAIAKQSMHNAGVELATGLLPSIAKAARGFANVVNWVVDFSHKNPSLVKGLALVAGGLAVASVAVWAFNAAMAANPITIILIGLAALAAGLVVAYNKVGWFRNAVNAAWSGIKIAISAVVDWWQKTAWPFLDSTFHALGAAGLWVWHKLESAWSGIKSGLSDVGNAAMWLYHKAIKPTFDFIAAAGKWLWGYILGPIFALWLAEWKLIGGGVMWLWSSAIHPFFQKIGDFASWLWNSNIKPAFNNIKGGLVMVGGWGKWLWSNAIQPSFQKIGDFAGWLWNKGIKPYIDFIISGLKTLGHWASWLWGSAIQPAWNSIGSGMHSVYTSKIHPVVSAFQSIIKNLKKTFSDTVSGIGDAWHGLVSVMASPINVVIGFIDDHFIKGFNSIMSSVPGVKLRLPMISKISTGGGGSSAVGHGGGHVPGAPGMARGGILPGMSRVHQGDDQLVPMRRGEGVYVSEAMRDPFERARLFAVNAAALSGKPLGPYQQGFSVGGIIGSIGNTVGNAVSGAWNAAKEAADILAHPTQAVGRIIGHLLGGIGNSWPAQVAVGGFKSIAGSIGKSLLGMIGLGGGGGSLPLGGSGKPGSGWQWMWNVIHSKFPGAVLTSAYRPGAIVAGSGQVSMHALGRAIDIGGSVPLLTTIARWIAGNYGTGPRTQLLYTPAFGNMGIYNGRWYPQPSVTVAEHGNHVHWGYSRGGIVDAPVFDQGGVLAPGINVVNNKLGRPEHLVRADSANNHYEVHIHAEELRSVRTLEDFIAKIDQRILAEQG